MHAIKDIFLIPALLLFNFLMGQNYQAINGSSYAGSLGVGNNPASIVHVPYAWDVTPFAVQAKQTTNAFKIEKYSLLSSPGNAEVSAVPGIKKRFVFANQDLRILNTRIGLNSRAAIAFGANIRNYLYATSAGSNWQDTLFTLQDFMKINTVLLPLAAQAAGGAWGELYATYAQTIIDDGDRLLNAGLTLKITRALAGGYARAEGISYTSSVASGVPAYTLSNGSLQYAYSSNFDKLNSNNTASIKRF